MGKKCNCEQKKTVVDHGRRILLQYNNDVGGSACYFCGEFVKDDGLDFFVEGTNEFRVCERCATKKAPELALIHEHAHYWKEEAWEKAFNQGVVCGKTTAGQMIFDAIDETELDRVDLGAEPCREEDVPF